MMGVCGHGTSGISTNGVALIEVCESDLTLMLHDVDVKTVL
jgi:hypothetical protein